MSFSCTGRGYAGKESIDSDKARSVPNRISNGENHPQLVELSNLARGHLNDGLSDRTMSGRSGGSPRRRRDERRLPQRQRHRHPRIGVHQLKLERECAGYLSAFLTATRISGNTARQFFFRGSAALP